MSLGLNNDPSVPCYSVVTLLVAQYYTFQLAATGPVPGYQATCVAVTDGAGCVLQVEVHRLVWFVGILAFTVAMILFVIGLIRKMDPLNAFVNGFILVVVANVPEVSCWLDMTQP
jgi:hypothetical protein